MDVLGSCGKCERMNMNSYKVSFVRLNRFLEETKREDIYFVDFGFVDDSLGSLGEQKRVERL